MFKTSTFLAAGALALAASSSALAQRVGTSAAVRGDVFVTTRGAERRAAVRQGISLADRVLTKDASALQILLLDASTFTVAQNANVVIDRFVYDPDRSTGEVAASVTRGAFRFVSGRIAQASPRNASVQTPSATIGIRGTMLEGIVGEDAVALAQLAGLSTAGAVTSAASIVILRGPGGRRNSIDRAGSIIVANGAGTATLRQPNYGVFVPGPGQAPVGPFKITPDMQSYLDFFLRSEPSGPPVNPTDIRRSAAAAGQTKFQDPVDLPEGPGIDYVDDAQDPVFVPEAPILEPEVPVIVDDTPPVIVDDTPPVIVDDTPPVIVDEGPIFPPDVDPPPTDGGSVVLSR